MFVDARRSFAVLILFFFLGGGLVGCDTGGSVGPEDPEDPEGPVEGTLNVSTDSLDLSVAADAQRSDTAEFTVGFDSLESGPTVEASGALTAEQVGDADGEQTYTVFYDGAVEEETMESISVSASAAEQDLSKSIAVTVAPGPTLRIDQSLDGLGESMGTLEEGAFSASFKRFLGLQQGDAASAEWAAQLVSGLESVLRVSNGRFQFQETTGVYAWDSSAEEWTEEGSSDAVVLEFPASDEASDNNATFTLSSYSDTDLMIDEETVYLPTAGTASLTIDEEEVFSIDLSGAEYTTEEGLETPIPQAFSLSIFTAPHTHDFELAENSSTEFDFSFDLSNGDQAVFGFSTTAQLATDDYDTLEPTEVEELSGEVRVGADLTMPYTAQVGELAEFDDPTEEQINNRIDAAIEFRDVEIGTLRYDEASEAVEVVLPNGSVVPASQLVQDFLNEMEGTWSDYLEGNDVDLDSMVGPVSKYLGR